MSRKQLSVNISDFAELITGNYYFVDKSLMIKERLECGACATLLLRPRGFGKSLNMSMLRYFFEKTETSNRHLFAGLKIEQHPKCMEKQGQYPVIFLTFKDAQADSWELCYPKICEIISAEYKRHLDVIKPHLHEWDVKRVSEVANGTASEVYVQGSLKDLTTYLRCAHGEQPIVLVDEYDDMMQTAFEHGYYKELAYFMLGFLSEGLKDNSDLEFAVMSGTLLVAKDDSMLGGSLNHLLIRTIFNRVSYSDKFGFLEAEVIELLEHFGKSDLLPEVRSWHGGYQCGDHQLYNPRSTINSLQKGTFQAHLGNANDQALLSRLLKQGGWESDRDFERMLQGASVTADVDGYIAIAEQHEWRGLQGLMLMRGYASFENYRREGRRWFADLKIPNREVYEIWKTLILSWFQATPESAQQYQVMLKSFVGGNNGEKIW